MRLHELKKDLESEILERKEELVEERYASDTIHEIVDGWVPIYNGDLAQMLIDDLSLGYLEPETLHMAGEDADVFKIIQTNLYALLSEHAYGVCNDNEINL